MMPRKLYSRMTTEQEQMAAAFVRGDLTAYERAEAEQEKLMNAWYQKMSAEQRQDWTATVNRLDNWVVSQVVS